MTYHFKTLRERREMHLHDASRARAIAAEAPNTCLLERYLKLELDSLTLWGLWGRGMLEAVLTANNYRKRALDLRKEALTVTDADTKKILLSIADQYELLAMNAECITGIADIPNSD